MSTRNLRHVITVSVTTMGSRVLGLGRDILIFGVLGTSLLNSAFIVAFTIPNLFRRLLGEGALTSAVIPVLSERLEQDDREAGFRFMNRVLSRLTFFLVVLTGAGVLAAFLVRYIPDLPGRVYLVAELSILMLPYMIFICVSALYCAALQVFGRFGVPALSPVLLNLCMIFFLGVPGLLLGESLGEKTLFLTLGVLVGGFLQWLVPGLALLREGWRPRWDLSGDGALGELWRLLLPGLAGAAVLQLNILISRLLAYSLDEAAVSELYLASRLMELPLGVFTIAVVTVVFPDMARRVAARDPGRMAGTLRSGLRLILAITVPAAVGLVLWGGPILEVLFAYGAFDRGDVARVAPLLALYGIGLPLYSAATLGVRGLHAMKDMRTPVRIAVLALALNLGLSLLLMGPLGAAGLAFANIAAAGLQAVLLLRAIRGANPALALGRLLPALGKILPAAGAMGLFCFSLGLGLDAWLGAGRLRSVVLVAAGIPAAVALYFGVLALLKFEDLQELAQMLRRKLAPPPPPESGG